MLSVMVAQTMANGLPFGNLTRPFSSIGLRKDWLGLTLLSSVVPVLSGYSFALGLMELSRRQAEVAALLARGLSDKAIAHDLGLSVMTVRAYVRDGAKRLPGEGQPRSRLLLWFFNVDQDKKAG